MSDPPEIPESLGPLNPGQADAVGQVEGPLLILAGAGSGKTRVLTRRIAYMLHLGVDPEQILAVTFTNKAASEMKERVAELVGGQGRKLWVGTFHSTCCRILRNEVQVLGYTKRFAIYDDDDQRRVIRQIVGDLGYDPKVVEPKALLAKIDHHKNRMTGVEDLVVQRRARGTDALVRVWRDYDAQLMAADAMDFNDLINRVVQLFEAHPDVLAAWRERFQYVLVDEYQDTNHAQYRLLRALAGEHRNLAVVGDDDQSIYGFRGADIRNILDFEKDFPDATVVRLEQNYRCTDRILEVANAVVAHNEGRIVKRLFTDTKRGGERVTFVVHEDPRAEASAVANAVAAMRRRGRPYADVAVIYRTNMTSQPFEAAFRDAGIPHKVVGGRPFYARREVRDALGYVRLITNPADDAAFLRIANVPPRGLGTVSLRKLRDQAQERGEPLMKTARAMATGEGRMARSLTTFVRLIDALTDVVQTASLPAFVQQVLERSGYIDMLRAEDTPESRGRMDNLTQLLRDAAGFEPDDGLLAEGGMETAVLWLERVALTGSDEELPEHGEVTLMTVHTSKGLEFPVVFVVNMVEGQFPHARSVGETGGVDEERRLAYVAFTRAQDRLIVSRCRHQLSFDRRRGRGVLEAVAPSRFLFGLPLDACEGAPPGHDEEPSGEDPRARNRPPSGHQERVAEYFVHKRVPSSRPRSKAAQPVAPPQVPSGEYRTREITSMDDLHVGLRVLHDKYGVGEVAQIMPPNLFIRFEDSPRPVRMGDPALQILRD